MPPFIEEIEKRFEKAFAGSDAVSAGLEVAVDFESESREFYENAAKKTSDAGLRELFLFLAKEEQKHFDALSVVRQALQDKGVLVEAPSIKIEKPKVFELKARDSSELSGGEHSAVLSAMRAEKESKYYYSRLAAKSKDFKVKGFFEELAGFEQGHYALLDGLFEQLLFVPEMVLG